VHLQKLADAVISIFCQAKPFNFIGFCNEESRFSTGLASGFKGVMTV